MVRTTLLHLLFPALLLAPPGAAQDEHARDRDWFEHQVGAIASSTDVARCEKVLELWAWRLGHGAAGADACADLATSWAPPDLVPILDDLVSAGPLPAIVVPTTPEALRATLVEVAGESPLERHARCAAFVRGVEAAPTPDVLDALPDHPWAAEVRAAWAPARALLAELVAICDALDLPVDPATAGRVVLRRGVWAARFDVDAQREVGPYRLLSETAWVVSSGPTGLTLLDDRLRLRRVVPGALRLPLDRPAARIVAGGPLPRVVPGDLDRELAAWLAEPRLFGESGDREGPLEVRSPAGSPLRAWWAARSGRPWDAAEAGPDRTQRSDERDLPPPGNAQGPALDPWGLPLLGAIATIFIAPT